MSENFQNIDEIAQSKTEDISKIEGIEENTAEELISRAKEYLEKEKNRNIKKIKRPWC